MSDIQKSDILKDWEDAIIKLKGLTESLDDASGYLALEKIEIMKKRYSLLKWMAWSLKISADVQMDLGHICDNNIALYSQAGRWMRADIGDNGDNGKHH